MSPQDGWMSLCLIAALMVQPQAAQLRSRLPATSRPVHRRIALKEEPPRPGPAPQEELRLVPREPRPTLFQGLPAGCRF